MGQFGTTPEKPDLWKEAVKGALFTNGAWDPAFDKDPKAALEKLIQIERTEVKRKILNQLERLK